MIKWLSRRPRWVRRYLPVVVIWVVAFTALRALPDVVSVIVTTVLLAVLFPLWGYAVCDYLWTKRTTLWLHHLAVSLKNLSEMPPDQLEQMPRPLTMILDSHNYYMAQLPIRDVLRAKVPSP